MAIEKGKKGKRGQFLILKRGQFLLTTPRPASSGDTRDGSIKPRVPIARRSAIHPTVIVVSARKRAAKATFTESPLGRVSTTRQSTKDASTWPTSTKAGRAAIVWRWL
jgi:hypothetical protein